MEPGFLVVGWGSIGRRHASAIRHVLPGAPVTVLRRPGQPLDAEAPQGVRMVDRLDDALAARPAAAVVANPAPFHVGVALDLASAGVHLLVEKPLSDRLDDADLLLRRAGERGVMLQVGYCLRFDPSLRALRDALVAGRIGRLRSLRAEVGQYLPDWRPGTDYRQGVTAQASLGGGALLELSHEVDIACWLGGAPVNVWAELGRVGGLEIDVEDTAELLLGLESGITASVHVDLLQRVPRRSCVAVGEHGTLAWDGIARESRLLMPGAGAEVLFPGGTTPRDHLFHAQFRHFLDCIGGSAQPSPGGADGRLALAVVEAARRSARESRKVSL